MLAPPYAALSARAAVGRRVLDQLVRLADRCLMPLIQPEGGGPGRRVWRSANLCRRLDSTYVELPAWHRRRHRPDAVRWG